MGITETYKISLKAARVNAGLKQMDAAMALQVDRSTIINWELGHAPIGVSQFTMLCQLYNMRCDYIFLPVESTKSRLLKAKRNKKKVEK